MNTTELREAWMAEARELGHEHTLGLAGGGESPLEIINLQELSDAMGGDGISWGELSDLQAEIEGAYEEGKRRR